MDGSILSHRRFRHLQRTLLAVAVAVAFTPARGLNGGTTTGYVLDITATVPAATATMESGTKGLNPIDRSTRLEGATPPRG